MADLDVPRRADDDRPITVLIVDNNVDYRGLAVSLLGHAGYEVVSACDGQEALGHLRAGVDSHRFVVLTGLMMPKLNGWQLLDAIEVEDWWKSVVVVVVTGVSNPGLRADVWCVEKPLDSEKLLWIVRGAREIVLSRSERAEA